MTLSRIPPLEAPAYAASTNHALVPVDGVRLCSNSPAFKNPNSTAKTNGLDDAPENIVNLKQDLMGFFASEMRTMKEELQTSLRASLQNDITAAVQGAIEPLENDINAIKNEMMALKGSFETLKDDLKAVSQTVERNNSAHSGDIEAIKDDIAALKGRLEDEIRAVNRTIGQNYDTYHDGIKAAKDDLTQKINALGQGLNASIAARVSNSIARVRNGRLLNKAQKLTPLHSLSTNLPIMNFPESIWDLNWLDKEEVARILDNLDDPFLHLNHRNQRETLKMLTGVDPTRHYGNRPI